MQTGCAGGGQGGVQHAGGLVLVADVGGTWARVGAADLSSGPPAIVHRAVHSCAAAAGLGQILADFMRTAEADGVGTIRRGVVAVAGKLHGDALINRNLPWPVSLPELRAQAGLEELHLINDFEALAWAVAGASGASMQPLDGRMFPAGPLPLPILALGAGTGLGAALVVDTGHGPAVLPSEAGHAALAPADALESEVVARLHAEFGHVACERVLSGPGLLVLYRVLAGVRGLSASWSTPADVVTAANSGDDALAVEAVERFCAWLGGFAGDMALVFGARSVCLAGGLAGHLLPWLRVGGFMGRFRDKGGLDAVLQDIPVVAVEHGELGMLGAAQWLAARA